MKKIPGQKSLMTSAALLALALFACSPVHRPKKFMAGAAVSNITPPAGAYIAGDRNNRKFTGVHDSLYVKALVVSDRKNSMAVLTFDCVGLLYPELKRIRTEVAKRVPLETFDPANIVITSTHTHSGPDVVGIWGPDQLTTGLDTSYMNDLVNKSADAIVRALNDRKEASVRYAITEFGSDWVYNISDSLNIDRSLNAIQFTGTDGKSIATITAFACHPTIMDAATSLVSADYVYGLYSLLNKEFGGVNLFFQGAVGGWVQPEYEKKNFEAAEKRGMELGRAVESALQKSIPVDSIDVRFKKAVINLPISNPGFKQLSAAGVINRTFTDSISTEIAWFSIGNIQFATHPGETTPVYSLETKALMKNKGPKIVMGFGMDALGYILSPGFFEPGTKLKHIDYLMYMSIDKEAGPVLMKKISELAR
jgi:hypothetical protein